MGPALQEEVTVIIKNVKIWNSPKGENLDEHLVNFPDTQAFGKFLKSYEYTTKFLFSSKV